jgi:RNA polymerase I-specific transcription initiation factor RRN3
MISVAAAPLPALSGMAATPLKSALKRKHSDLTETGDDSQSSTHSKRPKVQFSDSDNKTELIREWNDKTLTLVREEVRRAIERHLAGDSALYDTLRQTLTTKPTSEDAPSPTLLRRYVIALTGFSSLMGKKCGSLVDAVLDSQWLGRDEDFVTCYRRLLVNLIATNGGYAHSILDSLVDKFVNRKASRSIQPCGVY